MRLIQAKVDAGSLENWRKRISLTPVLKAFRVRPIDVTFDGKVCTVAVMNLQASGAFTWDLCSTDQLITQLSDIGISVNRVASTTNEYGLDLTFDYRVNL